MMTLPEGIQRYEQTQHEESEHRVGQPPAVAIHQILGPWHEDQRAYAGATEHQPGGKTAPLVEPQ